MNCINCGAPLKNHVETCQFCETVNNPEYLTPVETITKNKRIRMKGIYPLCILFGFSTIVLIYTVFFDMLTNTMLIRLTPAWFFPLILGLYGFRAEMLLTDIASEKARDQRSAYDTWIRKLSAISPGWALFAKIFFFPLPLFMKASPLKSALAGAAMWGLSLFLFFEGIVAVL